MSIVATIQVKFSMNFITVFLSLFGYLEHCNQHELFKLAQTNRVSQTTIAKSHVYRNMGHESS